MRKVLLTVLFLGWLFGPPSGVQKANEAFQAGKYAEAAAGYTAELENYHGQQPALNFNTAQSWIKLDSVAKANMFYGRVTNAGKEVPVLASWAWNNIGCMLGGENKQAAPQGMAPGQSAVPGQPGMPGQAQGGADQAGKIEQALQAFKDALKLDPNNDFARYNYELLKRKQQQQQQQQDQNQDQQNQDQQQDQQQKQDQNQQKQQDQQNDSPQNQENKGNQNQQKPGEGENPQEMNAAEAARLLDAMNANEKKFLQQVEKGKKHKTYNHDGPDW